MAGLFQRLADRSSVYRTAEQPRLWRRVLCAGILALGFAAGGCSTSYQLGSLFGKDDDKPTGATTPLVRTDGHDLRMPSDVDLAYAKVAAAEILDRGGSNASQPWENPKSGARGTVTPLAATYRVEGNLCRDFLASYISDGSESWLQGEACRAQKGKWEIRRMKPWRS